MADITSADFKQLITAITESNAEILAEQAKTTQKIEENTRESLRSSGDLAGFDRREEQKQRDEEAARDEENAAAEAEAARIAAEKAEKNGTFLGKITNFFRPDSADEEDEEKAAASDSKMLGYLKSIGGFLGGMAKGAAETVKGGFKGIGKFLFGAMLVGILAFLNSPKFEEIKNTLIDVVVPALTYLYEEIIKPLAFYIGGKLKDLFEDLKSYVDGDKGIGEVITENIGIIAGIVAALAPGLTFGLLKSSVLLIGKGLLWASAKTGITAAIVAGFGAVKAFFVATLFPFVTSIVGLFAIIGAVIAGGVAIVYGLYKGVEDFYAKIEAGASAWDAFSSAISTFFAEGIGLLLNPIKDGLSYVIEKIGSVFGLPSFMDASKALDDFNFVDFIYDSLLPIVTAITDFIKNIVDSVKNVGGKLISGGLKLLGFGGDDKTAAAAAANDNNNNNPNSANTVYKNGRLVTDPEEKRQIYEEQEEFKRNLRKRRNQRSREKAEEKLQRQKQFGASSAGLTDPRALAGPMPSQAAPIVVNAPATTNVNAPNTTNMSSSSTPMINSDRVFDKLSAVP